MPAKPDPDAENHNQRRQADDIQCFDKCLCPRLGLVERVEALLFSTHDGNIFTVVQVIDDIQDIGCIGSSAAGIEQIVFEHLGGGHHEDFTVLASGNKLAVGYDL